MTFGSISCSDSKASTTKKKKKKSVQRIKLSPKKKKKCLRDHEAREGNASHDLSFWKALPLLPSLAAPNAVTSLSPSFL